MIDVRALPDEAPLISGAGFTNTMDIMKRKQEQNRLKKEKQGKKAAFMAFLSISAVLGGVYVVRQYFPTQAEQQQLFLKELEEELKGMQAEENAAKNAKK